jgi:hypothetical protein
MKAHRTTSIEEFKVAARFENLRQTLLADSYREHLEKPLAYWALPSDRRLPLALLGRKLRDLLETPFGEISATPGIGEKKICSFVQLLARAASTDPGDLPSDVLRAPDHGNGHTAKANRTNGFDPTTVSEITWAQWRASVVQHALGKETLGRLTPSLKNMTRVNWDTPLEAYTGKTLSEIRAMKTHGEKRVRAVLEVFYSVHKITSAIGPQAHLVLRIIPRLIDGVEQWVARALQMRRLPSEGEICEKLVRPLLEQVRIDAVDQIVGLAENRLGIAGPIVSVREASRTMGLTRARVYQLLNEINDIIAVRWPTGRRQMYNLREKLVAETENSPNPPNLEQFHAAVELFYPSSRRGADGPLEPVIAPVPKTNGHVGAFV